MFSHLRQQQRPTQYHMHLAHPAAGSLSPSAIFNNTNLPWIDRYAPCWQGPTSPHSPATVLDVTPSHLNHSNLMPAQPVLTSRVTLWIRRRWQRRYPAYLHRLSPSRLRDGSFVSKGEWCEERKFQRLISRQTRLVGLGGYAACIWIFSYIV